MVSARTEALTEKKQARSMMQKKFVDFQFHLHSLDVSVEPSWRFYVFSTRQKYNTQQQKCFQVEISEMKREKNELKSFKVGQHYPIA